MRRYNLRYVATRKLSQDKGPVSYTSERLSLTQSITLIHIANLSTIMSMSLQQIIKAN